MSYKLNMITFNDSLKVTVKLINQSTEDIYTRKHSHALTALINLYRISGYWFNDLKEIAFSLSKKVHQLELEVTEIRLDMSTMLCTLVYTDGEREITCTHSFYQVKTIDGVKVKPINK